MDTCVDAATASCGAHNFCLDHLKNWVSSNAVKPGGATCPVCRVRIQQKPEECRVNIGIRDAIESARASVALGQRIGISGSDTSAVACPRAPLIPYGQLTFETNKRGQRVEIGRGAFSSVYAATYLGEPVAVKSFVLPAGSLDASMEAVFWREATLQYHLRHDGIAELHGVSVDRDDAGGPITEFTLVMPRFPRSLDGVLFPKVAGPPPSLANRLKWLYQIAQALRFLHTRGIVHGDVKPANILLDASGNTAKVCDFGHARLRREGDDASLSVNAGGTPRYRDPAVAARRNALRKASDVYSFGILAWHVLCIAVPFEGMDVAAVLAHTVAGGRPPLESLPAECTKFLPRNIPPFLFPRIYFHHFASRLFTQKITTQIIFILKCQLPSTSFLVGVCSDFSCPSAIQMGASSFKMLGRSASGQAQDRGYL